MQSKKYFLCVIHDKMDHSKTTLPRLQMKNKMVSRLGQLLVTLIRMIVHGHGDETFIQYFNEMWPNDPNLSIGSLLCLFCNPEKEPIGEGESTLRWLSFDGSNPFSKFISNVIEN
jgi:hypothetical protein